jgi:hypothetical protein
MDETPTKGKQVPSPPDPYAARKELSFEEAEGITPLPTQLALRQISQEFRAILWSDLNEIFEDHCESFVGEPYLEKPWSTILKDVHVYRDHLLDKFPTDYHDAIERVQKVISKGSWSDVLGWLEFVFKHPACPNDFEPSVSAIMMHCRLACRVIDSVVICPITSDLDRQVLERAFADTRTSGFAGARDHLGKAATTLTSGHFADSIRESIHAVESVVRVLESDGNFGKALAKVASKTSMHAAMKEGFSKLYGFTSDENGIRHPLLEKDTAAVDETDALFMIGACSAFVSYLINKARSTGLIAKSTAIDR